MNRTHIIFKCTSSYLWYMLSIEDTSCIVFIRSFLSIQNYSFLIINLNKGSIKSIHSMLKICLPISFRFKYLRTAENSMTYAVSSPFPKAIMVHHRRVKSALSFSFLHPVINNHGTAHMRWMVELNYENTESENTIDN